MLGLSLTPVFVVLGFGFWICCNDSVFHSVCSEFELYQQYCFGSLEYKTFPNLQRVALGELRSLVINGKNVPK